MLPKPPPREGGLGFLYLPPYRVQGASVAGEATAIHIPELDLCFDMGFCPRAALSSQHVAISHGHMDHIGALAYFCSQRVFQGMPPARLVCPRAIAPAIKRMMDGYIDLEGQATPYELIPLDHEGEHEIKNNLVLRCFDVDHTCPAAGYCVVEKRSKLKPELVGLPQEKLREMRERGDQITHLLNVPLIAYTGDTAPGAALIRQDVLNAQIVIAECTFVEPEHTERAKIGKHLHLRDIAEWLRVLQCQTLVLTHVSRRSNIAKARKELVDLVGEDASSRVEFLMDFRRNRARYEAQLADAESVVDAPGRNA